MSTVKWENKVRQDRPNHFYEDSLGDPDTCTEDHNHPSDLPTLIEEMNLTVRAYNVLRDKNIRFVEQLTDLTKDEVLAFPNLGRLNLELIREEMAKLGFALKDDRQIADSHTLGYLRANEIRWRVRIRSGQPFLEIPLRELAAVEGFDWTSITRKKQL